MSAGLRYDALRRDLDACFSAAIAAVEPERLVADFLAKRPENLPSGRIRIAGFGKAAVAMARGALAAAGGRLGGGVLIMPKGQGPIAPRGFEAFEGGHPIPNDEGVEGARAVERLALSTNEDDLLLVLISGGGSALMTLPPEGVPLADIQATTKALLEAGADIGELNAVRKHLDRLKGGQLARAAAPARVLALVLSDVVGDPLDVIASGPVSADPTTFGEAVEVLKKRSVWDQVPDSVRRHLAAGVAGDLPETPKPGDDCFAGCTVRVVGNNAIAARAACAEAERRGYGVELTSTSVTGEAREVGAELARTALAIARGEHQLTPPVCVISAGETTVTVTGSGRGGRNQEVALGAAIALDAGLEGAVEAEIRRSAILIASLGTDGIDGPTDAAGAVAASDTLSRARVLGLDGPAALADNDSYPFFEALGDLVLTGPTGTNVMDLQFVLTGAASIDRTP